MYKKVAFILFVLFNSFGFAQKPSDVLLLIDGREITLGEFQHLYQKNQALNTPSEQNLEENLRLFVNFKLKVIEAENLGLDKTDAFIKELAGYRKQLAKPYLVSKQAVERLIDEAYERMQYEIDISHILVKLSPDASPKDSLLAWNKISKFRKQIVDDGEEFEKVAREYSDDPSARKNRGHLGFFTVFQMVYSVESAAYNTPVGEISQPFRSRFGYHIIWVHNKRHSRGERQVAHIMLAVPRGTQLEDAKKTEKKIKNIAKKLKQGADFEQLATEFSDDKGSANSGGKLRWFGTGVMVKDFEDAAFSLENIGDISEPVQTAYGWHVLKLIGKRGVKKLAEIRSELYNKISHDSRSEISKGFVISELKKSYNFSILNYPGKFYRALDTTIFEGKWNIEKAEKFQQELFTLAGKKYDEQDFAHYLSEIKGRRKKIPLKEFVDKMFDAFVEKTVIEYEESRLEKKYPQFAYIMQEYHDGILLFALSDSLVWSKAGKDRLGLEHFYEQNKAKYKKLKNITASRFVFKSLKDFEKASRLMTNPPKGGDKKLLKALKKNGTKARYFSEKVFKKGDNNLIDKVIEFYQEMPKKLFQFPKELTYVRISGAEKGDSETLDFDEIRGQITNDYQNYLEAEWVKKLREKYDVTINHSVLEK